MSAAATSLSNELQQIFGSFQDVAPMLGRLNADGHVIGISQSPTPGSTSTTSTASTTKPSHSTKHKQQSKSRPTVSGSERDKKHSLSQSDREHKDKAKDKSSVSGSAGQSKTIGGSASSKGDVPVKHSKEKDRAHGRSSTTSSKRSSSSAFKSVPSTSKAGPLLKSSKQTAIKMRAPLKLDVKPSTVVSSNQSVSSSHNDSNAPTKAHTSPPISPRKAVQSMTSLLATPLSTIPTETKTFDFPTNTDKKETTTSAAKSKSGQLQDDLALSEDSDSDNEQTVTKHMKMEAKPQTNEDPWDLDCIIGKAQPKKAKIEPPSTQSVKSSDVKKEVDVKAEVSIDVVVKKDRERSPPNVAKDVKRPPQAAACSPVTVVVTDNHDGHKPSVGGASSTNIDMVKCRIRLDLLTDELKQRMLSPLQDVPEWLRPSPVPVSVPVPVSDVPAMSMSSPSAPSTSPHRTQPTDPVKKRKLEETKSNKSNPDQPLDKRKATETKTEKQRPKETDEKQIIRVKTSKTDDNANPVPVAKNKEKRHKSFKKHKSDSKDRGDKATTEAVNAVVETKTELKQESAECAKVPLCNDSTSTSAHTQSAVSTTDTARAVHTPSSLLDVAGVVVPPAPASSPMLSTNKGTAALPIGKVEPIVNTALPTALAPQRPAHVDTDGCLAQFEHYQNTLARPTKHRAQQQTEHLSRMLLYLEAIVHFISACRRLRIDKPTSSRPFQMLKDTNELLKDVCGRFETASSALSSKSKVHVAKVQVLCARTQAVMYRHMYSMFRDKALRNAQWLNQNQHAPSQLLLAQPTTNGANGNTTHSNSTPSPSSSTGSSGGGAGNTNSLPPGHVLVLQQVEQVQRNQLNILHNLMMADYLWTQADTTLTHEHKGFFAHVDKVCGVLRHDSQLYELSVYVLTAVKWLTAIIDTTPAAPNTGTAHACAQRHTDPDHAHSPLLMHSSA